MGLSRQIAWLFVLVALGVGGYWLVQDQGGSDSRSDTRQPNPWMGRDGREARMPVLTSPLAFAAETLRIEAVGTAKALKEAILHPESSGEVTAVNIQPNQPVKSGDILLQLDDRSERLAVDRAQVSLRNARQLLSRYDRTAGTGAVPASTVDEARNAVELASVELRQAELALEKRAVKAPFDGVVGLTDVEVGDRIGPDDIITSIDDRSALLINFMIPEGYIDRVATGDTVSISGWNTGALPISGQIVEIDSRVDPVSRSVNLRARVDEPASWLRPGMSFAVVIDLTGDPYPKVPEIALQWGGDGAFFWTVEDSRAVRHPATIIQRQPGYILVAADVQPGARLVVEGIQRLRSGVAVNDETEGTATLAPPPEKGS